MKKLNFFFKINKIFVIYFTKLKHFFLFKLLNIKDLLIFKFRERKYLFSFFLFILYLVMKKKKNSISFFKSTLIMGIRKLVKSTLKNRQKYWKCYKYRCVLQYKTKKSFTKNLCAVKNISLSLKENASDQKFVTVRTFRMSKCFFFLFKRKYKKLSKKKKKTILFKIKKMIRKNVPLKCFHYKRIDSFFFKKRKELFFYNMMEYLDDFHLNFDCYTFLLYFYNSKNINFFFNNKKEFDFYYYNKWFLNIFRYLNESSNGYIYPENKTSIYRSKFKKFNYISNKHAISLIKIKSPENYEMFDKNLKKNKYSIKFLVYILFIFYNKYYIKFNNYVILTSFKRYFKTCVSLIIKNFFFLNYKFCRNNFLIFNKNSFFFFDIFLTKYSKLLLEFKAYYSVMQVCCWRFYGVYQLETLYMYLGFFFFKELSFYEPYVYKHFYNLIFDKYTIEKSVIFLKYKFLIPNKRFDFWLLGVKKNKFLDNSYYIKKVKDKIFFVLVNKTYTFLMFFVNIVFSFVFSNQKRDILFALYLKKTNIKTLIIKYRLYLYPLYRKNYYFNGFYYMYKKNYKNKIIEKTTRRKNFRKKFFGFYIK